MPRPGERHEARRNLADTSSYSPTVRLFWPVPLLPAEMGYLPMAVKLEGESTGQYFLKVEAIFYPDGVSLYGQEPLPEGGYPSAMISYDELAHIIAEADTSVRGRGDPPPAMTVYEDVEGGSSFGSSLPGRRVAGRLRVIEERETDFTFEEAEEELPF
jgi:hypothetical protein